MDLCIRNGTLVTSRATLRADLGIDGGKIAQIGTSLPKAEVEIDAGDLLVMPGAIDVHTHMDMPFMGTATADDFETGTRAAAAGGVTTILDFAIQPRDKDLFDTVAAWKAKAEDRAVIDYGFHVAVTHWDTTTARQVRELASSGFPSFKAFMAYRGALLLEDGALLELLQTAGQSNGLVMVHAENGDAIEVLQQQALARGETAPRFHASTRPRTIEGEATFRAISLATVADAPLYVVHVSCQEAIYHLSIAQRRGLPIYAESCPQYLGAITVDDYDRPDFEGAKFVCSPPLRERDQAEHLWAALRTGILRAVSSDHCPFRMDQKAAGRDDFTQIPNGVPGVETLVPLVWTLGVGGGHISPNHFVDLVATTPARLFGLQPHKGSLDVGADADIMLFDPAREVTLRSAQLHQNLDYTPYDGFPCRGYPVLTLSRGDPVWQDGKLLGSVGRGRLAPRQPFRGL